MNLLAVYMKPILAAMALSVIAGVAYKLYDKGRKDANHETTVENVKAGEAASEAAMAFRGCDDSGGVFDFATGKCTGAP